MKKYGIYKKLLKNQELQAQLGSSYLYFYEQRLCFLSRINVSMFERLINAPPLQKVPSNTLAIQRRMRKNICDLTREFYQDIVEIEDHKQCSAKRIGDKLINLPSNQRFRNRAKDPTFQLRKCIGSGREVPGVLPHIFFWTHKGIQTMSQVGLSRVNNNEADMALKLTMYLVSCEYQSHQLQFLRRTKVN